MIARKAAHVTISPVHAPVLRIGRDRIVRTAFATLDRSVEAARKRLVSAA